jgi:hypothetical protein
VVWGRQRKRTMVPLIRILEGKNDPEKYEKVYKFHVLKCWMFSFEG